MAPLALFGFYNGKISVGLEGFGDKDTAIRLLMVFKNRQNSSVGNEGGIKNMNKLVFAVNFDFGIETAGLVVAAVAA